MDQLSLFQSPEVSGMVTGLPIPQDKAVLYPMLIEPDHEASYHSYWRYSAETPNGWIIDIVRTIGFGQFNGIELIYCEIPGGEIQEFGAFHLFPAKEEEVLERWGQDALAGYQKRLSRLKK